MDSKNAWYLIAGLVIGFVLGALAVDRGVILQRSPNVDDDEGAMTATSTDEALDMEEGRTSGIMLTGKNTLDVSDQLAGSLVNLSSVALNEQGWVAIHEDADGEPGWILGATLVFAGERNNVAVELLRPTLAGKTYYAMLHHDDGDKMFDIKKDLPIKDSTGSVLMMKFVAE